MIEQLAESLYQNLQGHNVRLDGKVLDVGCKDGRYFEVLKKLGAEEVHGIDPEMQPEAKINHHINPNHLYECGIKDLPEEERGTFDHAIVLYLSLGGASYENRIRQTKALVSSLKPDGKILATFTSEDEMRVWRPALDHYFSGCGKEIISLKLRASGQFQGTGRFMYEGTRKFNAENLEDPTSEQLKVTFKDNKDRNPSGTYLKHDFFS